MTSIVSKLFALDERELALQERSSYLRGQENKNNTSKKKHQKGKEVQPQKEKVEISKGVYVALLPDFEKDEKSSLQQKDKNRGKRFKNKEKPKKKPLLEIPNKDEQKAEKKEQIKKNSIKKSIDLIIADDEVEKQTEKSNEKIELLDSFEIPTDELPFPIMQIKKVSDCLICLESIYSDSVTRLEICEHVFHPECLQQYFCSRINEMKTSIVCPIDGCATAISDSEVLTQLDEKYKSKYHSFQLKQFILANINKIECCPTPDCEYFSYKVKGNVSFHCGVCSKTFCLHCRDEWHDDMTCEEKGVYRKKEYENDDKFREFLKSNNCQNCPSCKFFIHKVEGCLHITCLCKFQFCYICGKAWRTCSCQDPQQPVEDDDIDFVEGGLFGDDF